MHITILNGPNLNMLGQREPEVYGKTTLADIEGLCKEAASRLGVTVDFQQTNHEGVLIDAIHACRGKADGLIINPGAYTHTSIALHDALKAVGLPIIEVHLSNIHARESFRHHSYVSPIAKAVIAGLGAKGYVFALEGLVGLLSSTA